MNSSQKKILLPLAGLVLIALCIAGVIVACADNLAREETFTEQFNGYKIFLGSPILQTVASGLNLAAAIFLLIRLVCGKRHELLPGEILGPAPTWLFICALPLFLIAGNTLSIPLFAFLLLLTGLAILFCIGYAIHLLARLALRHDTTQLTPLNCFATLTGICMSICWINNALFLRYLPI